MQKSISNDLTFHSMINYTCKFFFMVFASSLLLSCSSTDDKLVRQSLEDFLYDVAQKKADHFRIASKEKLKTLGVTEKTWSDGGMLTPILTDDENEIRDRWQFVLETLHEMCTKEEEGFDWSNYSIQSIHYNKVYVLENIKGVESYGAFGTVEVESNGKDFSFSFLITIANGEALYVNLFNEKSLSLKVEPDMDEGF